MSPSRVQKVSSVVSPVRWLTTSPMAIVDHAVAITREQPSSLYFALTTDTANAYAMLCLMHGHCSGVSSKTVTASNLTQTLRNDSNAMQASTQDPDETMLRGQSNIHNRDVRAGKSTATSQPDRVHFSTAVIFADGSDYGAERTLFPEVWDCISGTFPQHATIYAC
jgi:hypothetical protein